MILTPILVTLVILIGHLLLLHRKATELSFLDLILGAFILTTTQIVVTELLLGWTGILNRLSLIGFNLLVSLGVFLLSRPDRSSLSALACSGSTVAARFWSTFRAYPTVAITTLTVAGAMVLAAAMAWIYPDIEWDNLRYHLPISAQIIQSQRIDTIPTDTIFINTYPKNFELMQLWYLLLAGHDRWVNGLQIPFLIIGIIAVYRMARLSGCTRHNGLLFAASLASAPVVIQQLTVAMIDVMVAAYALLTAWAFYRYLQTRNRSDILLAGIAAGILAGGKGNGMALPVITGLMLIYLCWKQFDRNSLARAFSVILTFGVPAFLLSFHWYAKNWYLYGNPVEPFQLNVLGTEIFAGELDLYKYLILDQLENLNAQIVERLPDGRLPDSPTMAVWYAWHDPILLFSPFGRMGGLGSVWFIFLLPALPAALLIYLLRRNARILSLYAILLLPFLLFLDHQWITRYGISLIGLGAVAAALVFENIPRFVKCLRVVLALLLVTSVAHGSFSRYLLPSKLKATLNIPAEERIVEVPRIYNQEHGTKELYRWWRKQEIQGTKLIYHCDDWIFTYPLWDPNFSNTVTYAPDTHSEENWQRQLATADWVLVSSDSTLSKWTERQSRFELSYDDGRFSFYRKTH